MAVSHELIGLGVILLFLTLMWADLQHRKTAAMSALSDKITQLQTDVTALTAAIAAQPSGVTADDLANLDQLHTDISAITAGLQPPTA